MALLGPVVAVCKQYGPGRLPYADRRGIGAGYAMATVAAVTTTAFILLVQLVGISAIMSSWYVGYAGSLSEQVVGMLSTVPAGFVAGVVVWQRRALRKWSRGALAGAMAMLVMYPVSGFFDILAVMLVASPSSVSEYLLGIVAAPLYGAAFGVAAFETTFWLTLPLGAVGGYVHERARSSSVAD